MSVHVTRFLTLASLRVILIAMFTGSAFSATFNGRQLLNFGQFRNDSTSIDASPAGTLIRICPGTYREVGKDNPTVKFA